MLSVTGQAGASPAIFSGSTATSGQPATAPGLQGTAVARPGRAGRSGPHARTGRGQHHLAAHSKQPPAPLSTGMQKQQPAPAAASHDRHRQHHIPQQRSHNVVEPDLTEKLWEPQQQQVQVLQRNAGSRNDQDSTAGQAPFAAQPEQTGAGEKVSDFVSILWLFNHFLRTNALDHVCTKETKQMLLLSVSCDQCSLVATSAFCVVLGLEEAHSCLYCHHHDIVPCVLTAHNSGKRPGDEIGVHSIAPLPCSVTILSLTEHPAFFLSP